MKVVSVTAFLAAVVLSAGVANAQDAPAAGLMAGFNQSYFATQPDSETSAKQGFLIGAFGVIRRDKAVKIQPEVQFSQRRVEVNYAGTETTYSTSYLNLGLMIRTNLFKGVYSVQGPQFSIPVRSSLKVPTATADIKDNINRDFSLVVGVGKQFDRLGIEGRWDSGFMRVEDVPLGGFVKRNRALTFVAIVGF